MIAFSISVIVFILQAVSPTYYCQPTYNLARDSMSDEKQGVNIHWIHTLTSLLGVNEKWECRRILMYLLQTILKNIVTKEEIANNKQFLFLSQFFNSILKWSIDDFYVAAYNILISSATYVVLCWKELMQFSKLFQFYHAAQFSKASGVWLFSKDFQRVGGINVTSVTMPFVIDREEQMDAIQWVDKGNITTWVTLWENQR